MVFIGKGGKWGWVSGWAAWNTLRVCWMAEMGFVGKLRDDCGTEQVLSPGLVSLEKKN